MITAMTLFDTPAYFDGKTYSPERDQKRLSGQLERVRDYMLGHGEWRTIEAVTAVVGGSERGVSARLRDLRKDRFGAYIVDRRPVDGERGLFEYRVTVRQQ